MSELEDAVANDRELRQEIRNLQTRIFQIEAEVYIKNLYLFSTFFIEFFSPMIYSVVYIH